MIKNILVIPFILISFLMGCNDDSKDEKSIYSGIWYFEEDDVYLQVSNSKAIPYECSLNDGYVIDEDVSLSLAGNKLIITLEGTEVEITSQLDVEGDSLLIKYENPDRVVVFNKNDEIPTSCQSDAIEITYVSPLSANVGVEQTFIVNFDYRFTGDSGYIDVGFTTNEKGHLEYPYIEPFHLNKPETNSGSLEVSFTPNELPEGAKFYMSVDLNTLGEEGDYDSSVDDKVLIELSN